MSKALSLDLRMRVLAAVQAGAAPAGRGALRCERCERKPVARAGARAGRRAARPAGGRQTLGPDRGAGAADPGADRGDAGCDQGRAARGARRTRPPLRLRDAAAVLPPPPHHAQKKIGHASEQDRPDILKRRQDWFEGQPDLDPSGWSSSTRPGRRPTWPAPTAAAARRAAAHGRAARPLENQHLRRRPDPARMDRALRLERPDQPGRLRDLGREGARPRAAPRGHRRHGQSLQPQGPAPAR